MLPPTTSSEERQKWQLFYRYFCRLFYRYFTAYLLVFDCAILFVYCIKGGIHKWRLEPGNKCSDTERNYLLLKLDLIEDGSYFLKWSMEGTSKEIHYHDTTWENKYDFTTTCFTHGLFFRNQNKVITILPSQISRPDFPTL